MKRILCYGDSNTFGYDPVTGKRYSPNIRWTGRLQQLLGKDYCVVEEGCNGRTTVFTDPEAEWKNGLYYLKPCLNSQKPLDAVILMLGTNDMKTVYHATAKEIAEGAALLVDTILSFTKEKQGYQPVVILVSPPEIAPNITNCSFRNSFDSSAVSRSKELAGYYREIAGEKGCIFFDAAKYVNPSEADSLHLMPEAHAILAEKFAQIIQETGRIEDHEC